MQSDTSSANVPIQSAISSQLPELTATTPLFVVFNSASGSGDKREALAAVEKELNKADRPYRIYRAERSAQIARFADIAVRDAVNENGAVIAAGGDGTINALATQVLPTGRPFGILQQGTFNYSGRAHGIPEDIVAATQALLSARIKPIQVGQVNARIFLVNASLGLYPKLIEDREALTKQYGRHRVVAFIGGLLTLVRYRHQLHLDIEHDGRRESVRTPTLFVGNNPLQLEQVGLPEAEAVKRSRLAAVVVKPVGGVAMLGLAMRGALRQLHEADNILNFPFATMVVKSAGRRQGVMKLSTDGEICWMRPPLRFHVAPQRLMLMVPKDA